VSEAPGTGPQQPPAVPPAVGGTPARPPRTTKGLIGSMIATVLAVLAFVGLRAVNSKDLEVTPEPVDYLATVAEVQRGGTEVVYPTALPAGWMATSVDVVAGDRPAFGLSMLTDDGTFVGLRQEDAPLEDLLTTYVDEDPAEGKALQVRGSVAPTWQSFTDSGGDQAYAVQLGGDEVLVYGSASTDDLRAVLDALSTDRLPAG